VNQSLLDLFRADVAACGVRIEEHLAALAGEAVPAASAGPSPAERLEAIARDAHTIAAGARILGIEPAARIARRIETVVRAAARGHVEAGGATVDALFATTTLLARIAAASPHLDGWIAAHGQLVEEAEQALAEATGLGPAPAAAAAGSHPPSGSAVTTASGEPARDSLLALFRAEVEGQAAILGDGLVALEQGPAAAATIDALMRAAHSIKGAARVVGLDPVVRVTHALEECLVAGQRRQLAFAGDAVDLLLRAVDRIQEAASIPEAALPAWLSGRADELAALADALAVLGATGAVPAQAEARVVVPAAPAKLALAPAPDGERVVRIAAENLTRILALAGETVVESRWLDPFASSLLTLKRHQVELAELIDRSRGLVLDRAPPDGLADLLHEAGQKTLECQQALADRISDLGTFSHQTASLSARLYNEVIGSRMRPFADGTADLPRLVRDLARMLGKKVRLEIVGAKTRVDRDVLDKLTAPLANIVQNALDHGLERPEERVAAGKPEEGTLRIEARHRAGMLAIAIADDGRGVDLAVLRGRIVASGLSSDDLVARMSPDELLDFLFLPGFSLAAEVGELSGRGVGLDVVQDVVRRLDGVVRVESHPGRGMSVQLQLPVTRSVIRALLVEIGGEAFAFPLVRVDRVLRIAADQVRSLEGRQYVDFDGANLGLVAAHQVLELPAGGPRDDLLVVVISDRLDRYGLVVDRFLGERDLVVHPLDPRLSKVPDVVAASLMQDGTPVIILDVDDLVRSIDAILERTRLHKVARGPEAARRKRILVIDDSITVREVERRLLEHRGYAVDVAIDGIDGWNAARSGQYDLVVTDVDMPRMSGLDLIARIRSDQRLAATPVVIVSYRDREEDRLAGLRAGADQYLAKGSFHDDALADVVAELIGAAER